MGSTSVIFKYHRGGVPKTNDDCRCQSYVSIVRKHRVVIAFSVYVYKEMPHGRRRPLKVSPHSGEVYEIQGIGMPPEQLP